MPSAITLSSSMISTFVIPPTIEPNGGMPGCRIGDHLVTDSFADERDPNDREHHDVHVEVDHIYSRSFDELRTGFTAAVSHELRTPLARILALLDSADLPGADVQALIDQARAEVENAGALIDEILFLSELESGREVVSLGRNSLTHSFVQPDVKTRLLADYERAVAAFEAKYQPADSLGQLATVKPVAYGYARRTWGFAF